LKTRALKNEVSGASRTFVVCDETRVVAYYALATGGAMLAEAPGKVKRNMPDPIPVIVLGRLAIDEQWHGKGLGRGLLKDVLLRSLNVAQEVGVRALMVHAMSESAKQFYLHHGFAVSPIDDMKLFIPLSSKILK
jgi:GNAT superfamily N-acetyltransferase